MESFLRSFRTGDALLKNRSKYSMLTRRILYGLALPGAILAVGGAIWYYRLRRKGTLTTQPPPRSSSILDHRIGVDRAEYLVLEVQVPDYCVGSFIGKGGEAIKRVRMPASALDFSSSVSPISFSDNSPFVVRSPRMTRSSSRETIAC